MARERKGQLLTVEVDRALYAQVKRASQESGISIAFKIREALEAWTDSDIHSKMADLQPAKVEKDFDFGA